MNNSWTYEQEEDLLAAISTQMHQDESICWKNVYTQFTDRTPSAVYCKYVRMKTRESRWSTSKISKR